MTKVEGTATIGVHNCSEDTAWQNTETYNLIKCQCCGRIIKFRYKNTWKQIKMLFWDRVK